MTEHITYAKRYNFHFTLSSLQAILQQIHTQFICSFYNSKVHFSFRRVNIPFYCTLCDGHHEQKHIRSVSYVSVARTRFQHRIMVVTEQKLRDWTVRGFEDF